MNENRHTPGPWRAEGPDWIGDYNVIPPGDGFAVAAVVVNRRPAPEVAANARLIAAAPDLLDLAEQIVELTDGTFHEGDRLRNLERMGREAREAIARIKGDIA
jgi:hypothetical protein